MIRTFMSRLLLMRRSAVDWLPDKLSRSSRETPRAVLAFACVLLLVGVLLLCMMAIVGYLFLDRGQLFALSPSASGNFDGVLSSWIAILSLIWAGNALRVPAYAELRRRRLSVRRGIEEMPTDDRQTGELHSMAKDTGGLVSGILGFLIGPIMLFWAVLCWISNLAWLQANLPPGGVGLRFWTIPRFVGYRNFQVLCLWWSVAVILFVAGAGALWIGIRRLFLPSDCSE